MSEIRLPAGPLPELPSTPDLSALEAECLARWEETGIHRFDPEGEGEVFSVDTPPPYVSASHLHVGHAMSYTQAELIVRYHRMCGRRVFYPMGFDDNGLPTERYVEQTHGLDKRRTTRSAFRALCLEETRRGAAAYEALWRALGLSVDWRATYSTIDPHSQRTAQWSFLDLYRKGRIYRADQPVLWDPVFETSLAQADVETLSRRGQLHHIAFGDGLEIATTRPELLPACVALYAHPDDGRYAHLVGTTATVPLFGHTVPVRADRDVRPDYGTGLMMVCTFGDDDDVRRWRRDGLATRTAIGPDGRLTELAGPWSGSRAEPARKGIVKALKEAGLHRGQATVEQHVPVAERSGAPVEWVMAPQWFVRVLDRKEALRAASRSLRWHPAWMKSRLDHWIDGLQWDWNISRQRFYGVPLPVWLCDDCGEAVLAREADLPVDPLEQAPPVERCPRCDGALRGDPDVMDTWMTSSVTPLINRNLAGTPGRIACEGPMTVRVQAFEIIRTWLFYTLLKSEAHEGALPWRDVMISGWGLNEQGRKISKRDLERHTDAAGFNRYEPHGVIRKYGADAVRWWAASSHLGHDVRYSEKDVRAGRKLAIKLWNAARLVASWQAARDPDAAPIPLADRPPEDRWLLARLDGIVPTVREGFETYDYALGRDALDRFFWSTFCDDWLEIAKDRLTRPERYPARARQAAMDTGWEALRILLGLLAPYVPFVTDALWLRLYRPTEGGPSLHVTRFPEARGLPDVPEMGPALELLRALRSWRTERRIPQSRPLASLTLDRSDLPPDHAEALEALTPTLGALSRADHLIWGPAGHPVGAHGLRFDGVAREAPPATDRR